MEPLRIDVVSDVVCPWCYIGKRRLEAALETLRAREPDLDVQVHWHPFQLNPELPAQGIDRRNYLNAKFGGPERAAQIYDRVRAAGESAGLTLDFNGIKRQPNTIDAHRLVAWAQAQPLRQERVDALIEALFRAYFVEGRFIGDRAVLAQIAGEAGYDPEAALEFIASDRLRDEVSTADERARTMGIGGVPFFIFDGKLALSGAQEPTTIVDAIAQARATAAA